MKKIIGLALGLLMAATSVFAYEPKAECVVNRKNMILYLEKVDNIHSVLYNKNTSFGDPETRYFVIYNKKYPEAQDAYLKNKAADFYSLLEISREYYYASFDANLDEKWANHYLTEAIYYLPLINEDNVLTITEEDYFNLLKEYRDNVMENKSE